MQTFKDQYLAIILITALVFLVAYADPERDALKLYCSDPNASQQVCERHGIIIDR